MPIDRFLPEWEFAERHRIRVDADAATVDACVRRLDLGGSRLVRLLFRLRGMPADALRFEGLERAGFIRLADEPGDVVKGLVGRFWTPSGCLLRVAPADFVTFDQPGYALAAWSFGVRAEGVRRAVLETETRVHCTDAASRRSFARYWLLIRPFSGLIRRLALRAIRRDAERAAAAIRVADSVAAGR